MTAINERLRLASIFFMIGFGPGRGCFTKIAFNYARFQSVFRAADLLSNSEPLCLKDGTTGFTYGGQKNASADAEQKILRAASSRQCHV